jgi:hypothetical protein
MTEVLMNYRINGRRRRGIIPKGLSDKAEIGLLTPKS